MIKLTETECSTSSTVHDRTNPGDLPLINGEMGAARPLKPLSIQDIDSCRRFEALSLNKSGGKTSALMKQVGSIANNTPFRK